MNRNLALVCMTILLLAVIAVAGVLLVQGKPIPAELDVVGWLTIGLGVLANLVRTNTVGNQVTAAAETVAEVQRQTNGHTSRLQLVADLALAELPPDRAKVVLAKAEAAHRHGVDPHPDTPDVAPPTTVDGDPPH